MRSWLVRSAMDDHQGVLRGVVSLSLVFFGVGGDLAALLVEPPSEEAPESLRFMALSARVRGGGLVLRFVLCGGLSRLGESLVRALF